VFEILKFTHILGVVLGIGGGLANAVAAAKLASLPPETGPIVGGFREALGKMSTLGLVFLWLSGIALIGVSGATGLLSDPIFLAKMAAVLVLTGFSIAANVTVISAKKAGGPPDMARMKLISQGALISGLLALVLAVVTFAA